MTERRKTGQLIAGVLIAGLGLLFALERMTGFYVDGLYRLWPLIIIGIGVAKLLGRGAESKERGEGLFMVALGSWFLINSLELFGLSWGDSWPLLLLFLGVQRLILPGDEGGRAPGLFLVAIGSLAFMALHGTFGLHWGNVWPLALIAVGCVMVWRAIFDNPARKEEDTHELSQ